MLASYGRGARRPDVSFLFSVVHCRANSLPSRVSSSAPCWPPSTAALKLGSRQSSEWLHSASTTLLLTARNSRSSLHCSSASWWVRDITSLRESLRASFQLLRQPLPPSSQPTPPSRPASPPFVPRTGKRRASRRERWSPLGHSSSGLRREERGEEGDETSSHFISLNGLSFSHVLGQQIRRRAESYLIPVLLVKTLQLWLRKEALLSSQES